MTSFAEDIAKLTKLQVWDTRVQKYIASNRLDKGLSLSDGSKPTFDDYKNLFARAKTAKNLVEELKGGLTQGDQQPALYRAKQFKDLYNKIWNNADYKPVLQQAGFKSTSIFHASRAASKLVAIGVLADRYASAALKARESMAKRMSEINDIILKIKAERDLCKKTNDSMKRPVYGELKKMTIQNLDRKIYKYQAMVREIRKALAKSQPVKIEVQRSSEIISPNVDVQKIPRSAERPFPVKGILKTTSHAFIGHAKGNVNAASGPGVVGGGGARKTRADLKLDNQARTDQVATKKSGRNGLFWDGVSERQYMRELAKTRDSARAGASWSTGALTHGRELAQAGYTSTGKFGIADGD